MKKMMVTLLTASLMVFAVSAMATPITAIGISATGATSPTVIYDNDTNDAAAAAGIVSWSGVLGNFDFSVAAGSTSPAIGSLASPEMHLTGYATSGLAAGGTFTVAFSSTDFGPMSTGLNGFISSLNGLGGVQSLDVYYDVNNFLFAQTTQIADIDTLNTSEVYMGIPESSPFSLTMLASFTVEASQSASFDDGVAPVPEPATLLLLGSGLVGLAFLKRRKA